MFFFKNAVKEFVLKTTARTSASKRNASAERLAIIVAQNEDGVFDEFLPVNCPNHDKYRQELVEILARFIVHSEPKKISRLVLPAIRKVVVDKGDRKPRARSKISHSHAATSWASMAIRNVYLRADCRSYVNLNPALVIFPWKIPKDLMCLDFLGTSGILYSLLFFSFLLFFFANSFFIFYF